MKKHSKKEKIILLLISSFVGILAFCASYGYFLSQMTDWQKTREIDFNANSGSTKFKARLDALSIGGLAFCASAITIISIRKLGKKQ